MPLKLNPRIRESATHNPSDGKIIRFVEIDRLKKHICIGARNDISMNAVQNAGEIARMPKMQTT